ncbi:hypothetical protein [Streptomyces cinereoruber]|uniref:hypothetical protein n=1 Tax=Streptomyces cinereoruber TaxID=67260 RepID=UPI003C2E73A8
MNPIVFWALVALCVGVEIWGQVIGIQDLNLLGLLAGFGVIAIHWLLLRADRYKKFTEAGEER